MNSRWPEYDYYYHLSSIHAQVERNQQVRKAKQVRKPVKLHNWDLRKWLVRTLGRLHERTLY